MTFKERMTEKANKYDTNDKIKEHIDNIKNKIELFYTKRRLTVTLINVHANNTIAIGGGDSNRYQAFIPGFMVALNYQQLFVDAFKELGFADEDMEFVFVQGKAFDEYNIILKW